MAEFEGRRRMEKTHRWQALNVLANFNADRVQGKPKIALSNRKLRFFMYFIL